jgi:hypothetical protein
MTINVLSVQLRKLLLVGLVVIAGVSVASSLPALAADGSAGASDSIALTPATQKIAIKAGATVTSTFTVINDGETKYDFIVYGRPYSIKNELYEAQFEKTSANTDLYQWVNFEKVSYSLAPGERVDIPYSMQVPATAAPGGHYGVLFAETQPDSTETSSVLRKKRVGSIVLANVEGKITNKGGLIGSEAKFWQPTAPLTAVNRIENTGNTDFQAIVATNVEDMFGSIKYGERKEYVVYPSTVRRVTSSWDNSPWFGLFKVKQTITVLGKSTNTSHLVLMTPRWLVLLFIALIVFGAGYYALQRRNHN